MTTLTINPLAGTIGAEILGVDLSGGVNDSTFETIHDAFLEHLVIFFPEQKPIAPQQLSDFAARFGELDIAPFVYPFKTPSLEGFPEVYNNVKEADNRSHNIGGFWHADVTYRERPHLGSVIYAKEVPSYGGDTLFANQYLAYESLPGEIKEKLADMQAMHSSEMIYGQGDARFASVTRSRVPETEDQEFNVTTSSVAEIEPIVNRHPVVRVHPDTGRKALYVNRGFTTHFEGMTLEESRPLLEELWAHASRAEFTCRYRWSPNSVGVWDNRAVQHYAINDYFGQHRHMMRISIHEPSRPV
jgi:taurine dioxygenase